MFIHEEPAWPLPPYCLWVSITAPFIWGHLSGPMNGWGDERDGGAGEGSCGAVPSPFPAGQAHWDPSILLRENRAPCPHTVPGHRCVPPLLGRWKALGVQEGSSRGAGGSDEAFLGLVKGKEQESCTDTQMLLFQVVWFPRLSLSFPRCSGELEPCLVLAPGTAAGGRSGAHLQAKSSWDGLLGS